MLALPRRVPDGFIRPRGVGSLFFFFAAGDLRCLDPSENAWEMSVIAHSLNPVRCTMASRTSMWAFGICVPCPAGLSGGLAFWGSGGWGRRRWVLR